MTYDEFIDEYGDKKVKFHSYYKYSFTFSDGFLSVGVGGDHNDIYRFEVAADEEYSVASLEPSWADINGEFHSFGW